MSQIIMFMVAILIIMFTIPKMANVTNNRITVQMMVFTVVYDYDYN